MERRELDGEVSASEQPSGAKVYRSSAMAVVIAWSLRLIGLVSVLVLARVLTPGDFGIVAIAMSTLAIVDVFSALGLRQALIMCRDPERSHYDTAWTIQLLVLVVLFFVLLAIAPLVADFYGEPVLTIIISVLATRFIFFGLANIAVVDFDRNLNFGRDLKMRVSVRLTAFVVTLTAALVLRNYWALVIGGVAHSVLHMIATYVFHPFRPRFSFARRAELLGISLWMFIATAAHTAHNELERFVVGRIGSMGVLGLYSVSKDLSHIFTQEIAIALNRVTFVTTAKSGKRLVGETERLAGMLGAYAMISAPLGLGIAATAPDAVSVLLGSQWGGAVPYLRYIAPAAALFAVYKLSVSTLQAAGDPRQAAFLAIGSTALIASAATLVVTRGGSPFDLAQATLGVAALQVLVGNFLLGRKSGAGFWPLVFPVLRPFLAAGGMALAILSIGRIVDLPFVNLVVQVLIGFFAYAILLFAIWRLGGAKAGAESKLFAFAQAFLTKALESKAPRTP